MLSQTGITFLNPELSDFGNILNLIGLYPLFTMIGLTDQFIL